MKTDKLIYIDTTEHRTFTIEAHEVIDHRSKYYASRDSDTSYQEEYQFLLEDDDEVTDWLFNNMDWYECETLKERRSVNSELSDLEVLASYVSEGHCTSNRSE